MAKTSHLIVYNNVVSKQNQHNEAENFIYSEILLITYIEMFIQTTKFGNQITSECINSMKNVIPTSLFWQK